MPVDSITTLKMERARLMQQAAALNVDIDHDYGGDPYIADLVERKRKLLAEALHLFQEIQRLEKLNNHG